MLAAIDDVGSLNAAARKLHLTPSALSQQLRELEGRLGGPLFLRQWRRLELTAAGRRLTESARSVIAELLRVEVEARELVSGTTGSIRVATACQQSYGWLPGLLATFRASCPTIDVRIVAEASAAPCDWLAERRLDVALVTGDTRAHPRVRRSRLFRDELVALVGSAHPWAARAKIELQALSSEHLWTDAGALEGETTLGRAFAAAAVLPRKVTLVPTASGVAAEMARANLGVTIVPKWTTRQLVASGDAAALRLGARGLWLEWFAATRDEAAAPVVKTFLEALRAHHPGRMPPAPATKLKAR